MPKRLIVIGIIIILISIGFGGCINSNKKETNTEDLDNDGYNDEVDAFPNDPNEYNDYDGDAQIQWLPNFGAGGPVIIKIDANFTASIDTFWIDGFRVDEPPYNVNQGNGSWEYSGEISQIDWGNPRTHVDEVWFVD